ncbi:uncharacterized protein SPPG_04823 [Spizellomyces punctatus DAOM BR117]|uniref:Uncharacterized protein n=1 Tax=Spizellomyces punctatus (strain DAOM BR117) TaxID=645134 RepID=A0A0L0HGA1_SPIPD|nr:uncharacterized protein SPPG_04823 [Spizellomyces punctatus DAOM BR117]KND00511.1 hypothetical protein SPPG_04823 [Spizellomyces punctatus DAOM BR117]|eukprot:XP_016608550.1 hypothetical protein SPPG_04823 [Spizellomyces punctatus DAOM BR117]
MLNSTAVQILKGVGVAALTCLSGYYLLTRTRHGRRVSRAGLLYILYSLPDQIKPDTPFPQRVQPHGPLEKVTDGLWIVTGIVPGSNMPRIMPVYRPPNSTSLLLYSVLCADESTMAEIDALGTVTHIYIPCSWHTIDAAAYKTRYPNAKLIAPRASLPRIKDKVKAEVQAAEDLFPAWTHSDDVTPVGHGTMEQCVRLVAPQGVSSEFDEVELLITLPNSTKTAPRHALLLNDLLQSGGGDTLKFQTIGLVLMVDRVKAVRDWFSTLMEDVVRKRNVEILTRSHGKPIIGSTTIERQLRIALGSL